MSPKTGAASKPAMRRVARPRTTATTGVRVKREPLITTDHEEIRKWAEERGAQPATVKGTGRSAAETGMIRLDFPGYSGEESLQPISWEEWFIAFDKNKLALVYEEKMADGKKSNFNKLVSREGAATRL